MIESLKKCSKFCENNINGECNPLRAIARKQLKKMRDVK